MDFYTNLSDPLPPNRVHLRQELGKAYSQTCAQQPSLGPEKVRFRLVFDESNQPLLTGGHCSEVVVKAGLTDRLIIF